MTTPRRFDLYGPIHKAVRRFLNDTLQRVGAMDAGDEQDVAATMDQLSTLLVQLKGHLKHENDFLHTAIEARLPGGAKSTADDHVDHLETIAAIDAEVRALRGAPPPQRVLLAARLYRHLSLFVAENFNHMDIEETVNQPLLWALYDDDELLEIHERLVAAVPPQEMMEWMRWMVPSLTPQELAGMLSGMQAKAPPDAFRQMLSGVRTQLDPTRWAKLSAALPQAA